MTLQTEFRLSPRRRGCHLITREIVSHLPSPMPRVGLLHVFVKHTSCALTINENADPDVLTDLDAILDHVVPDSEPYYCHTMEGPDDMSAHGKSTLAGVSLTIPVTDGRLNLGRWQGIYLCEFRDHATARTIVLTVIS
ncbi:MAG: YjbQ family protein [Bacteroidales bacterium]|nr:YjbQ family protein [Bacteroidales bacterium]MDE6802854.1 secondary thiamine-phosphate synthase enzyme YjbQ [Muribaculaceae bacterium]MDE6831684.1 secondary thiamine-phosphate synthase enzyme YjbQ [Muribaculaceae bacterium]